MIAAHNFSTSINEAVVIARAYDKLGKSDKVNIFSQAMRLVNYMDDRDMDVDFYDALEILAKLGIWMVKG